MQVLVVSLWKLGNERTEVIAHYGKRALKKRKQGTFWCCSPKSCLKRSV